MGGRGASSGGYNAKANSLVRNVRNEKAKIPTIHASGNLTGSEKQVKWANEIRSNAVKSINDSIKSDADQGMKTTQDKRDAAISETTRRGKKKTPERMERGRVEFSNYANDQIDAMKKRASQAKDVQDAIDRHKDASWWIDNRRSIHRALGYRGPV